MRCYRGCGYSLVVEWLFSVWMRGEVGRKRVRKEGWEEEEKGGRKEWREEGKEGGLREIGWLNIFKVIDLFFYFSLLLSFFCEFFIFNFFCEFFFDKWVIFMCLKKYIWGYLGYFFVVDF